MEHLAERTSRDPQAPAVYEEDTFRHFLALERMRAEKRGRSLLLLLVDLGQAVASSESRAAAEAAVFEVLDMSVRESDFLGWYAASRVAGAVLVQGDVAPSAEVCKEIGRRTAALLQERLPGVKAEVKVLQLDAKREGRYA